MAIKHLEHVGIVVDDLSAAVEFFVELGLELEGKTSVEGESVDRIVGLEGVRADVAILVTPEGTAKLELSKFRSPLDESERRNLQANAPGIRHILLVVEGIDDIVAGVLSRGGELVGEVVQYENSYRLCYLRGPEGIIVELAEKLA